MFIITVLHVSTLFSGSFQNGIYDQYHGDSGRTPENPPYNISAILTSNVNVAIRKLDPTHAIEEKIVWKLRSALDLKKCRNENSPEPDCTVEVCLFDLHEDPCETTNVARDHPNIVNKLEERLKVFSQEAVQQTEGVVDPKSNPKFFNDTWSTWLDEL